MYQHVLGNSQIYLIQPVNKHSLRLRTGQALCWANKDNMAWPPPSKSQCYSNVIKEKLPELKTRSQTKTCTKMFTIAKRCPHLQPFFASLTHSSPTGLLAVLHASIELLPQGLCTCCSRSLTALPADVSMALSLTSFRSLRKCHLLSEVFPG